MARESCILNHTTAPVNDETSTESKPASGFKRNVRSGEGAESKEPDKCKVSELELRTTDQLNQRFKGAILIFCTYLHTKRQQLKCTHIIQWWFLL